jgi:cytochrome c oxidase subunit 3
VSEHHSDHPAYLGHHYDTPEQQFDSGKLGMWLFLATEVLLFAGLFCAYAIYRAHHPEIFKYSAQFLDTKLGGINTVVLITSSFTMAMAVRAAQLGKKQVTAGLLVLTLLGGVGFMAIKKVEYEQKWKHGLLWGTRYQPEEHGGEHGGGHGEAEEHSFLDKIAGISRALAQETDHGTETHANEVVATDEDAADSQAADDENASTALANGSEVVEGTLLPGAAKSPEGLADTTHAPAEEGSPENVHLFFGIYFLMTGLHGIHVIAGMIAIGWVLRRTLRGDFSKEYSTPVDLVGLYWHIVDLVWIYLFPLLYLID